MAQPDRYRWLERLLGQQARRLPAAASDGCLDAETLAAWVDGVLRGQDLAAAERHASSCPRCTALLASMVRTAPDPDAATEAHGRSVWLRWFVPLAAAATAVAIWVAIPEQQATPVASKAVSSSAAPEPPAAQPAAPPPAEARFSDSAQPLAGSPEPGTFRQKAESRRTDEISARARDEALVQDAREARQARARKADAPEAEQSNAAAPVPSAAPVPAATADALNEAVGTMPQRMALSKVAAIEASTSDPLVRWRVLAPSAVERTTNGGKTWVKTSPAFGAAPSGSPALTITAISAVDALGAAVTTSDGRTFSTTDGGATWAPVQGNPAAPF